MKSRIVTNLESNPLSAWSSGGICYIEVRQEVIAGPKDTMTRSVCLALDPLECLDLAQRLLLKLPTSLFENPASLELVKEIEKVCKIAKAATTTSEPKKGQN